MSRCFTKFPIRGFRRTHYITLFGGFYKKLGSLWRVSDCEELVGAVTVGDVIGIERNIFI